MRTGQAQERLYGIVLIGFLAALVAVGLLGVPALLVAAGGALVAALAIFALHARMERVATPRQYVPSVLVAARPRRRRGLHPPRRGHAAAPFRSR